MLAYLPFLAENTGESSVSLEESKSSEWVSVGQLSLASGIAYCQQGESRGSGEIPDLQGVYSIATVIC